MFRMNLFSDEIKLKPEGSEVKPASVTVHHKLNSVAVISSRTGLSVGGHLP